MRLLFTSTPLFGHFMPMLPLLDAAVEAGHEVVVATGPDLAGQVGRRGLTVWHVGPSMAEVYERRAGLPDLTDTSQIDLLRRDAIAVFGWPGYQRARGLLPRAIDWLPDIVVHEVADFAGWEVSAASGALSVGHGYGPHLPHTVELLRDICAGAVEELGTADRSESVLASLYVDPWPTALRGDEPSPWSDVIAVRPEPGRSDADETLPAEVEALVEDTTVYVTFGTVFGSTPALMMVLQSLRDLPCSVVATTGPTVDPASLGPLPDNAVVSDFLPQQLVLARSAAVVSHAGSGTVLAALAARLPQVCLPLAADQFVNAEQVGRRGAGLTISPENRDIESIRAAVKRVLDDDTFATQAAALQDEIDTMTPASHVLTHLERRVTQARPH